MFFIPSTVYADESDLPEITSLTISGITAPVIGETATTPTVTTSAKVKNADETSETKTDVIQLKHLAWNAVNLISWSSQTITTFESGNTYIYRMNYSISGYKALDASVITIDGAPEGTTVILNGTQLEILFPTLGSDEISFADVNMANIPAGYLGQYIYHELRFKGGTYPYTVAYESDAGWLGSNNNDYWGVFSTGISYKKYRPTTIQATYDIVLKVTDAVGTTKSLTLHVGEVKEDPNAIKDFTINYEFPAVGASKPRKKK